MSWLSDATPLVPGGWLSSAYAGHGILGADVPAMGLHGPSAILNDLVDIPADLSAELRLYLETSPPGLTSFWMDEDGSIIATGAPGSYVGLGRLFADGVDRGTASITINFGSVYSVSLGEAAGAADALVPARVRLGLLAESLGAGDFFIGSPPPSFGEPIYRWTFQGVSRRIGSAIINRR
jgi:hypothetical protein